MAEAMLHMASLERGWSVEFGSWKIRPCRTGTIWIEHESGEGMEVKTDAFVDCIATFYREKF